MQYKNLILKVAVIESPFEGGQGDVKRNHNDVLRALEITILEIEQKEQEINKKEINKKETSP